MSGLTAARQYLALNSGSSSVLESIKKTEVTSGTYGEASAGGSGLREAHRNAARTCQEFCVRGQNS